MFASLPVPVLVLSGYYGFLTQSKDMLARLISDSKLVTILNLFAL